MNVLQEVPDGSRIFDCFAPPDLHTMQMLKAAGFNGCVLYPETAAQRHVDWAMQAELGLMFVGECRHDSGWEPTGILGSSDALRVVGRLRRLDIVPGLTLTCDVEGTGEYAQGTIDYVNAWTDIVGPAVFDPQMYVGAWIRLNAEELFHAIKLSGYWRAGSIEPEVAVRGYRMRQIPPLDRTVFNWKIDVSEANADHLGGRAKWMIAAPVVAPDVVA
jgi:hypothetical protein